MTHIQERWERRRNTHIIENVLRALDYISYESYKIVKAECSHGGGSAHEAKTLEKAI